MRYKFQYRRQSKLSVKHTDHIMVSKLFCAIMNVEFEFVEKGFETMRVVNRENANHHIPLSSYNALHFHD